MRHEILRAARFLTIAAMTIAGCATQDPDVAFHDDLCHFADLLDDVEYADAVAPPEMLHEAVLPPAALRAGEEPEYWPMTLQEAIRTALAHSNALNDLGGTIVRTPETIRTLQDPSLEETDPRFGVAAALSAFDAELSLSGNFEKNDRFENNRFSTGAIGVFQQDLHNYEAELRKRAATGTEFILRHTADYDFNNANGNIFPSAWDTAVEAEFRHPLLQGGGLEFNRIAGPDGAPGVVNGVVVARLNTDISLTDLEVGLRNLVSNVENAYWDLYFAYRDLNAKRRARDASLNIWRRLDALAQAGVMGAEEDKVEHARETFYRFEVEVQNALNGRPVEGTRAGGDSSGGTFRASGGVYVAERRLRLLLGLPINGYCLIRPSQDPPLAKTVFDWDAVVNEALTRRAELRRQRLTVKRRELELVANSNFLRPRLDAVGLWRWRGFGDQLLDPNPSVLNVTGIRVYDSAWGSLTSLEQQEWQLGFEFSMPLGFRRAHAAIRNSQLALARERAVLCAQERQVVNDLSNAISELERAYHVAQVNLDRRNAAKRRVETLESLLEPGARTRTELENLMLDAQQRLATAESDFFRSLVEYALAVKNVHIEKGTWKNYECVFLAEDLTGLPADQQENVPESPLEAVPAPEPALPDRPAPTAPDPGQPGPSVPPAAMMPIVPQPMPVHAPRPARTAALPAPVRTPNARPPRMPPPQSQPPNGRSAVIPAATAWPIPHRPPSAPMRPSPSWRRREANDASGPVVPPGVFDSAVEASLSSGPVVPPGVFDSAVEASLSSGPVVPPGVFDSAVEASLSSGPAIPPGIFDSAVEAALSD